MGNQQTTCLMVHQSPQQDRIDIAHVLAFDRDRAGFRLDQPVGERTLLTRAGRRPGVNAGMPFRRSRLQLSTSQDCCSFIEKWLTFLSGF
jgi:hypothetical protein